MTGQWFIEREGRAIVPGSGGRHRRYVEPSLAGLVLRRLLTQARGVRR